MRRALAIVFLTLLGVAFVAGPALAQRDPFDPAIDVDGTAPPETGPTEPAPNEPEPEAQRPPDDLANTGVNVEPWLVLAFALVAAGTAALAIAGLGPHRN
jgi:hypothetical protein